MNIINIEHISKLFGDKLIFDDASFGLQEGDKVGIVGINGTGKSTLLRMAAGEETPDSGQIIRQNNLKMAYLPQTPEFPKDATVLSYALSGDEEDWQVQSNLVQLGITEYDAKLDTLSGGQRRRIDIARALLQHGDEMRPILKKAGLLTRDPRMKERKKYGLKAARRAPQFSKR